MAFSGSASLVPNVGGFARMPEHPRRHEVEGSLAVATVFPGFDRQGWTTVIAAVLLALITLFTSYDHVSVLGSTAIDRPQQ